MDMQIFSLSIRIEAKLLVLNHTACVSEEFNQLRNGSSSIFGIDRLVFLLHSLLPSYIEVETTKREIISHEQKYISKRTRGKVVLGNHAG
jgi:hypothetical protein